MKNEFSFLSSDGKTIIRGYIWRPEKEVKAVVQLAHGMGEHIGRYEEVAEVLTSQGYAVIGHSHLGHGRSVLAESERGYFAGKKGWALVLKDMYAVTELGKETWPGRPLFLLGYSMGSLFARRYITVYPGAVQGLILACTGYIPYQWAHLGGRLVQLICLMKGDHFRSRRLEKIGFRLLGPSKNWGSHRPEVSRAFWEDPYCSMPITAGAYKDVFRLLKQLAAEKDHGRVPKDLPVLLLSGMKDPLGCGPSMGVLKVYNRFKAWGLEDVDLILYKDDRHDLFNEADRADVFRDLLHFMDERVESHDHS